MTTVHNEKNTTTTRRIILACVLLVVGILFCLKLADNVVSIIIGAALIIYGLSGIIFLSIRNKPLLSVLGIYNAILLAIGIVFIAKNLMGVFISMIPYILTVVGFVLIIDAILGKFQRKTLNTLYMVLELLFGIACVVFGLCLMFVDGFATAASIIFGVFLILIALIDLGFLVIKKK